MRFGTSWSDLGLILEPLGSVLAASWGHLGEFLEPTSEHLGSQLGYKHFVTCFFGSCVYLGFSGGDLGCILRAQREETIALCARSAKKQIAFCVRSAKKIFAFGARSAKKFFAFGLGT